MESPVIRITEEGKTSGVAYLFPTRKDFDNWFINKDLLIHKVPLKRDYTLHTMDMVVEYPHDNKQVAAKFYDTIQTHIDRYGFRLVYIGWAILTPHYQLINK
jgi:hypothetical protein